MTVKKIPIQTKVRNSQDSAAMNAWVEQGAENAVSSPKPAPAEKEPPQAAFY